jgi:hypothetical protein
VYLIPMKSNLVWESGLPSKPGVYWFDVGLRMFPDPMVIRVAPDGSIYGYGDYGSGPIDYYYNPKVCPDARHLAIAPPRKWLDLACIKRDRARAWVRHPEGYLGFGLLRPGYNRTVGGSVLWLDHPTEGEVHGDWMSDDYEFSPVRVPILK